MFITSALHLLTDLELESERETKVRNKSMNMDLIYKFLEKVFYNDSKE